MVNKRKLKVAAAQPPVQVKPGPKQALPEKDREILNQVGSIIWNPDLLKKFQNDGNGPQGGSARSKKPVSK